MRIDSVTYFNASLYGMRENQTSIARLTQQLGADQRVLQPKDDPIATERILDLSARVATRTQFSANQDQAALALKYETTVLLEMQKTMNSARAVLAGVQPGNDAGHRENIANSLAGFANQLLDLANTRDPAGNYIFGGFNTIDKPYTHPFDGLGTTATTYVGTPYPGGTRSIEVDVGRLIQVNDNLDGVFLHGNASSDLLRELDEAVAKLRSDAAPPTQQELLDWLTLVDGAITTLNDITYRVTAAYGEVEDVRTTTKALLVQEQNALYEVSALDKEEAILSLQMRQTALEAAQRAYAKTSGLSLFNFL